MSLFDKARRRQRREARKAEASTSRPQPPPLEPEPEPEPTPPPARELEDPYYRYQPSGEQYPPSYNGAGAGGYHPSNPFHNLDDYYRLTTTVNPPPNYSYPYGWEPHNGGRGIPGHSNNDSDTTNNPPPSDYGASSYPTTSSQR